LRFTVEQQVRAPAVEVIAALTDAGFLASLGELADIDTPELLDQSRDGDRVTQRVHYRFTGRLPSAITRVIDPAKASFVEQTTYDLRACAAETTLRPDHYADRLSCAGTVTFTTLDGTTTRRISGDIRARFPLVGPMMERAFTSVLRAHFKDEAALLARWLAVNG
jgi:hypothetical protein